MGCDAMPDALLPAVSLERCQTEANTRGDQNSETVDKAQKATDLPASAEDITLDTDNMTTKTSVVPVKSLGQALEAMDLNKLKDTLYVLDKLREQCQSSNPYNVRG